MNTLKVLHKNELNQLNTAVNDIIKPLSNLIVIQNAVRPAQLFLGERKSQNWDIVNLSSLWQPRLISVMA